MFYKLFHYKKGIFLIIGIIFLDVLIPYSVCAKEPFPPLSPFLRNLALEAQKDITTGRLKQAQNCLSPFLKGSNPHPLLCFLMANTYYLEKRLGLALKFYEKTIKGAPKYLPAIENAAAVAFELKRYQKAANYYLSAWQISRKTKHPNKELLYNAAIALYQAHKYKKTIDILKQLFKKYNYISKQSIALYVACSINIKSFNECLKILNSFINNYPYKAYLWLYAGQIFLLQKDYKHAAIYLETAYTLKGANKKQWKDLSNIYAYCNAPIKAAKCYLKAINSNKVSKKDLEILVNYFLQIHNYNIARKYIKMAINLEPDASLYVLLGKLAFEHARFDQAKSALKNAILLMHKKQNKTKLKIKDVDRIWMLLGISAFETNDFSLAKRAFSHLLNSKQYRQQAKGYLAFISLLQSKKINKYVKDNAHGSNQDNGSTNKT